MKKLVLVFTAVLLIGCANDDTASSSDNRSSHVSTTNDNGPIHLFPPDRNYETYGSPLQNSDASFSTALDDRTTDPSNSQSSTSTNRKR